MGPWVSFARRTGSLQGLRSGGRARVTVTGALLLLAGCDMLGGGMDRVEDFRVLLEGPGSQEVEVIIGNRFLVTFPEGSDASLVFLESDTTATPLPYDRRFRLSSSGQFAVRVQAPVEDSVRVTMTVLANGSQRLRRDNTLLDRPIEFYFLAH